MECEECRKIIKEGWENTWPVGSKVINICYICYWAKVRADKEIGNWKKEPIFISKMHHGVIFDEREKKKPGRTDVISAGSNRENSSER